MVFMMMLPCCRPVGIRASRWRWIRIGEIADCLAGASQPRADEPGNRGVEER